MKGIGTVMVLVVGSVVAQQPPLSTLPLPTSGNGDCRQEYPATPVFHVLQDIKEMRSHTFVVHL
jgi:hypothetical protein